MMSPAISLVALTFGLISFTYQPQCQAQVTECAASSNADYEWEVVPEDGFEIRWIIDEDASTVSFEIVSSNPYWAAIGFSEDGLMVGSDAVIGVPSDGVVQEYDLEAQSPYAVTAYDVQEITDTSVTSQGDVTTVVFTRPLAPSEEGKLAISTTPGDETYFIYAHGLSDATSDNLEGHAEDARGSVAVDVFCSTGTAAESPTPVETPTASPTENAETIPLTISPASTIVGTEPPVLAETAAPSSSEPTLAPTTIMNTTDTMAPSAAATMVATSAPTNSALEPTVAPLAQNITLAPVANDRGVESLSPTPAMTETAMSPSTSPTSAPTGATDQPQDVPIGGSSFAPTPSPTAEGDPASDALRVSTGAFVSTFASVLVGVGFLLLW